MSRRPLGRVFPVLRETSRRSIRMVELLPSCPSQPAFDSQLCRFELIREFLGCFPLSGLVENLILKLLGVECARYFHRRLVLVYRLYLTCSVRLARFPQDGSPYGGEEPRSSRSNRISLYPALSAFTFKNFMTGRDNCMCTSGKSMYEFDISAGSFCYRSSRPCGHYTIDRPWWTWPHWRAGSFTLKPTEVRHANPEGVRDTIPGRI